MSIKDCYSSYHQMIIYDHQLYIFGLICNTPWILWYLCEKFDSASYYIITLQHAKHAYCRETADLYINAIKSSQPCCKYLMSVREMGRKRKTQKNQKENSTEITSDSQSLTDTHTHKHKPWAMTVYTPVSFSFCGQHWTVEGSGTVTLPGELKQILTISMDSSA